MLEFLKTGKYNFIYLPNLWISQISFESFVGFFLFCFYLVPFLEGVREEKEMGEQYMEWLREDFHIFIFTPKLFFFSFFPSICNFNDSHGSM